MHRLLLLDNHDSFTWILAQYLEELGAAVDVRTSDVLTVEDVLVGGPWSAAVLGPGPGRPEDAGITLELIRRGAGTIPMLGVCQGHQCIAQAFGAAVVGATEIVHGKTSAILHDGTGVFAALPSPFVATRYHSLTVDPATVPEGFVVHARTADGTIMGLRHATMALEGVQFHPESIATEHGKALLTNWLDGIRGACAGSSGRSSRAPGEP